MGIEYIPALYWGIKIDECHYIDYDVYEDFDLYEGVAIVRNNECWQYVYGVEVNCNDINSFMNSEKMIIANEHIDELCEWLATKSTMKGKWSRDRFTPCMHNVIYGNIEATHYSIEITNLDE